MKKLTIGVVAAGLVAVTVMSGAPADAKRLLTGKDIKDGSLTLKDFRASDRALLRGPAGANGINGVNGFANTTVVESPEVTVAAGDSGTVVAYCPPGTKVTGGGYFSSIAVAAGSMPSPGANSWGALINNFDNAIDVQVNAYAVCAS